MKKFKIPQIPQTTSKSIRFPNDVIDEVESVLVGTDCTFSAFVEIGRASCRERV